MSREVSAARLYHGGAAGGFPVVRTIDEAVEQLKRDPTQPVRTRVGDLTIELRAVSDATSPKTAAAAFAEIGPWEGETTEEVLAILAQARQSGGQRSVPEL